MVHFQICASVERLAARREAGRALPPLSSELLFRPAVLAIAGSRHAGAFNRPGSADRPHPEGANGVLQGGWSTGLPLPSAASMEALGRVEGPAGAGEPRRRLPR